MQRRTMLTLLDSAGAPMVCVRSLRPFYCRDISGTDAVTVPRAV